MVTLIALVHRVKRARLPSKRALLYREAVRELNARFLRGSPELVSNWSEERLTDCLSWIAWNSLLHEGYDQDSDAAHTQTVDWVATWLCDIEGRTAGDETDREARNLVDVLRRRSGLLVEPENPLQRFVHYTIGEFLAASHLANEDHQDIERTFAERLGQPRWSETLKLAAGLLGDPDLRGSARRITKLIDSLADANPLGPVAQLGPILGELRSLGIGDAYLSPLKARLDTKLLPSIADREVPWRTRVGLGDVIGYAGDPRLQGDRWVSVPGEPALSIQRWPVVIAEYADFIGTDVRGLARRLERWTHVEPSLLEELRAWLRDARSIQPPEWWEEQRTLAPNHPVTGVDWFEAATYCAWLEQQSGAANETIFLPNEKQWERSARHGSTIPDNHERDYPWRGPFAESLANTSEGGLGHTSAVGSYPGGHTSGGAWDMAGNVYEWCASRHQASAGGRVLRGGAFSLSARYARSAYRGDAHPSYRFFDVGFRPAKGVTTE